MTAPIMEPVALPNTDVLSAEDADAKAQIHAMLKQIEQMREEIRIDREHTARAAARTRANLDYLRKHKA